MNIIIRRFSSASSLFNFREVLKCTVAVGLLLTATHASATDAKPKPYGSIKILSYNILFDGGNHSFGLDRSVDAMLPFMKAGDFDVITLQEVVDGLDSNSKRLAEKLSKSTLERYSTGNGLFAMLKNADRSVLSRLPGTFGTFDPVVIIKDPVPYILLDAKNGMPQTYIGVAHTSAADDPNIQTVQDKIVSPFRTRLSQVKRLNQIGSTIDRPLILTGDFNAGDISERGLHEGEFYPRDAHLNTKGKKIPSNIPATLNVLKKQYQLLQVEGTREKFQHNDLYNNRYTWPGWDHDHEASKDGNWDRVKIDHIMAARPYAKWFKVITDPGDPYSGTAPKEAFVRYDQAKITASHAPEFIKNVKFVDKTGNGLDKDFNLLDNQGRLTGKKGVPQAISDHSPYSETVQWVGPSVQSSDGWTKIVWNNAAAKNDVTTENDGKTFNLARTNHRDDMYLGQIADQNGIPNLDALKDLQKQLSANKTPDPAPALSKLLQLARERVSCSTDYSGGNYNFSAADTGKIKSYCTDDHSNFDEVRIEDGRAIRVEEDAALGRTIAQTPQSEHSKVNLKWWLILPYLEVTTVKTYDEPLPVLTLANGTLKISGTSFDKLDRYVTLEGSGGTVDIAEKDEIVVAPGVFFGGGGLTKDGAGMLKLTSSRNSYKGLTTVNSGTLALSDNGSIASSAGLHLRNTGSTFDISRVNKSTTTTIAGLSGDADTKVELGHNTLAVNTNYDKYANGALVTHDKNGGEIVDLYQGQISGSEESQLIKKGKRTLKLTGASGDFKGTTFVNEGNLRVNGALGGIIRVDRGTLDGTGALGKVILKNGSKFSPGNSVGYSHLLSYNSDPSSIFQVEADQTGMDRVDVDGTADLNGSLVLMPEIGLDHALAPEVSKLLGKRAVILNAKRGIEGRFTQLESHYRFIDPVVDYTSNAFGLTPTRNGVRFADPANSGNQRSVANAIEDLGLGNRLHDMIVVTTKDHDLPADYDALSGEAHATLSGVLAESSSVLGQAATNRVRAAFDGAITKPQPTAEPLAYGPPGGSRSAEQAFAALHPEPDGPSTALWGEAYGAWAHADGDGNAAGFRRNIGGFVTGIDGVVAETWRMGVLAGYGNTSLDGPGSSASVSSYQIGLYGGTVWNNIGLRFGTALAHIEIDTHRAASFGRLFNQHSASYAAQSVQAFGEIGYEMETAYADFEPFIGASYVHLDTDGFQENGATSNLTGFGAATDLATTTLGLRASHAFAPGETTVVTAHGMLGWNHALGDVTPERRLAFAGGQAFSVEGLPIAEEALAVEAGFDIGIGRNTSISIGYTGQFSSRASDNAVKADLRVMF
jgi:outer membrane autotransporter protein